VLNTRIAELRTAGLVEAGPNGYRLTEGGRDLVRHFLPLVAWSEDWAKKLRQNSDPM
jgi:DNA-binding HxlR family transcriptional regulator